MPIARIQTWDSVKPLIRHVVKANELVEALDERYHCLREHGIDTDVALCTFGFGEQIVQKGALSPVQGLPGEKYSAMPLGLLVDGAAEIFETIDSADSATETSRTTPIRILGAGDFVGLFEALDRIFLGATAGAGLWSIASGARTIHMLGNYTGENFIKRLTKEVGARLFSKHVVSGSDDWVVVKRIIEEMNLQWTTQIVFFPEQWLPSSEPFAVGRDRLKEALSGAGWRASRFYLAAVEMEHLLKDWSRRLSTVTKPNLEFTRRLLTHLTRVASGDLPAFVPFRLARNLGPFEDFAKIVDRISDEKGGIILLPGYLTEASVDEVYVSLSSPPFPGQITGSQAQYVKTLHDDLRQLKDLGVLPGSIALFAVDAPPGSRIHTPHHNTRSSDETLASRIHLHPALTFGSTSGDRRVGLDETPFSRLPKKEAFFKAAIKIDKPSRPLSLFEKIAHRLAPTGGEADQTVVILHHHVLPTLLPMLSYLLLQVRAPNRIFVLGKSYSSIDWVWAAIKQRGFRTIEPQHQLAAQPGCYESGIAKDVDELWRAVKAEQEARPFSRVIIFDDGGRIVSRMPMLSGQRVIAVEQTTFGSRKSSNAEISVINVAGSAAKREFESPEIAAALLREMTRLGVNLSEPVGVLGFGNIGRCLAGSLAAQGTNVVVFDPKGSPSPQTRSFSFADNAVDLVSRCRTIVGCSGEDALVQLSVDQIPGGEFELISCSSGDVEFASIIDRIESKQWQAYGDDLFGAAGAAKFRIRNGGFPLNFNRQFEVEPEPAIMLTRALSFAGISWANQLLRRPILPPGPIMLDPEIQHFVCRLHKEAYRFPADRDVPDIGAWWSQNSRGQILFAQDV